MTREPTDDRTRRGSKLLKMQPRRSPIDCVLQIEASPRWKQSFVNRPDRIGRAQEILRAQAYRSIAHLLPEPIPHYRNDFPPVVDMITPEEHWQFLKQFFSGKTVSWDKEKQVFVAR